MLLFPVLLLLTIGIVDFARTFAAYISVTNAVREGALYAGTGTGYTSEANIRLSMGGETAGLTAANLTVAPPLCRASWPAGTAFDVGAIACPTAADGSLRYVQVQASYQMPLLTPVVSAILGGSVQIGASTVAPIVQP